MKISAFTFAKNAVKFHYPLREAILSALPLVDEFIVNVGIPDEDGTIELVRSINDDKIKIVQSQWNTNIKTGGFVLAQQTNIALFNCTGSWAIYLQADEVLHEHDLVPLKNLMIKYHGDDRVDGLSLERLNFYGDYHSLLRLRDDVCRVIKPHHFTLSRGDALGFCVHPKYKERGRRIRLIKSMGAVYHYGLIKSRDTQIIRKEMIDNLWNGGTSHGVDSNDPLDSSTLSIDEREHIYTEVPKDWIKKFLGSHPACMENLVAIDNFRLDHQSPLWRTKLTLSERKVARAHRISERYPGIIGRYFARRDCIFLKS